MIRFADRKTSFAIVGKVLKLALMLGCMETRIELCILTKVTKYQVKDLNLNKVKTIVFENVDTKEIIKFSR